MLVKVASVAEKCVSVIISNYNYGRYIGDSIRSVLEQTYKNIEIIVVDDGSTDESRVVISKFGNQISPIYSNHQGQCAALNAGYNTCKGDVIIFLDADDCLVPDAIERLAKSFTDNSEITKCQGYMNAIDSVGRPLGKRIPRKLCPSGDYKDYVRTHGPTVCNHSWTSGNAWAKWFLDDVMPLPEDINNSVFPDGCLNPLADLYGPIVTLENPVALYRIHENNHGPIGYEFSLYSLNMMLTRKHNSYEFVAERAENISLKIPMENWLKGTRYWKDKLTKYAISLMDPSLCTLSFREVTLAPFETQGLGNIKAVVLFFLLTAVWCSPKWLALEMVRRLLGLQKPKKIKPVSVNDSL